MLEERLNDELEDEEENLENENIDTGIDQIEMENTKVELLQYRSKEEIIKEIDSFVIEDSLSLKEKINKCRFFEELDALIKNVNFEENILFETFSGSSENYWSTTQKLAIDKIKSLPMKRDYIKSQIDEDKRKVDAENNKRQEAAKPKKEVKQKKEENKTIKYKYPFKLHFAGHNIETDHIFENEKEYSPEEITKKMLEHQFYEFAGSVRYSYMDEENVLIPIFQQYKKG